MSKVKETVEVLERMIKVGKTPCQNWEINKERMVAFTHAIAVLERLDKSIVRNIINRKIPLAFLSSKQGREQWGIFADNLASALIEEVCKDAN